AVVVDEGGRGAPGGIVKAGLLCHVGEGAVAVVEEELDAVVLSDEDVGPAVVVDVADRDAHVVTGDVQAGTGADVLEGAIGLLPEQLVLLALWSAVLQQV